MMLVAGVPRVNTVWSSPSGGRVPICQSGVACKGAGGEPVRLRYREDLLVLGTDLGRSTGHLRPGGDRGRT